MKVIDNPHIIYFDVDDTLITPSFKSKKDGDLFVIIGFETHKIAYRALMKNINKLKEHSLKGHYVVVWSQSGWEWAERVVKALDLKKYVNMVQTKPDCIYDDLDPIAWMPRRMHLDEDKIR